MSTQQLYARKKINADKLADILAATERDRAAYLTAVDGLAVHREQVRVTWQRVNERRRPSPEFAEMNVAQLDALTPSQLKSLNIDPGDFSAWRAARRQFERARRQVEAARQRIATATAVANRLKEFAQNQGVKVNEF